MFIFKNTVPGANLLANPGFETAGLGDTDVFSDWTESATDGAIAQDTDTPHGGAKTCKLTAGGAGGNKDTSVYQDVLVTARAAYALSYWAHGDGTNAGRDLVYDNTGGASIRGTTSNGVTGTAWTLVTYRFRAPDGCASVRIRFFCPSTAGGIAYFDDAALQRLP